MHHRIAAARTCGTDGAAHRPPAPWRAAVTAGRRSAAQRSWMRAVGRPSVIPDADCAPVPAPDIHARVRGFAVVS
jgi:hypothetical protein